MHDDSRPVSELREALDAVRDTGSIREALNAVHGTAPAPEGSADDFSWPVPPRQRQWPRRLGRVLIRVDVWILIVGIIGLLIAYLTLVKPG